MAVVVVTGASPRVVATESVRPVQGVPVGAHPDAFAVSPDGGTLFVALAGMNAIEVRDGHSGARQNNHPVYIPTGWYPSALLVTGKADHYRLWVANAKGSGPGPGFNFSVGFNGSRTDGTVSAIDLPTTAGQLDTFGNDQIHLSSHSRAIWSAQRSRRPRSPSENASLCWLSTSMRPITRSRPGPNTGTTISERVLPSVVR